MVTQDNVMDFRPTRPVAGGAMPDHLDALADYLEMIGVLLAEKAAELEPSWEQACDAAVEIATLQDLEAAVVERAIALRARNLADLLAKLAIWRGLAPGAEDGDLAMPRNRLILSVEADLARLARG